MKLKEGKARYVILISLIISVFATFLILLMRLQIGQGDYYKAQSEQKIYSTETITAPRGYILDRNGEILVNNRMGYNLILSRALLEKDKQNDIILRLVRLLQSNDAVYNDSLGVSYSKPFAYTASTDNEKKAMQKLLKAKKMELTASAPELMQKLIEVYEIDDSYTDEEQRLIAGVRYEMELREFTMNNPFTFAEDITIDVVTSVKERSVEFPGVSVETVAYREYTDGTFAPHILGRIGKIWAEEYADLKTQGYLMNDLVGKEGIEKAMESYLRGTNGTRLIERSSTGKVLGVSTLFEARQGNNVVLTIDKNLQNTAQKALESTIKRLQGTRDAYDACAGAAVAINVNTGEILASATYPSYDVNDYSSKYNELLQDKNKPLFNRAFNGTYAPGSTFKMATGIAGLEEGYVEPDTIIRDLGIYTEYEGYKPRCWVYTDYGRTHGPVTVKEAIRDSCNYYFYKVADNIGIEVLNSYCEHLGLGTKTGIELAESAGILAGPAYRASVNRTWYPGDTLQAAIGQSDNLFTPLQLAAYVSTIVNGGTRYKAHLVKSVRSSTTGRMIMNNTPAAISKIDMQDENFHAIMEGMRMAAAEGTASNIFAYYDVEVGAKTGTASVPSGTANGIFVAFAPYNNPEIAVSVVVEHGAHGNSIAPVARAIFDTYFATNGYSGSEVGAITLN